MTRLDWSGAFRNYEAGVDRGALYFGNNEALPWDGLVSVSENSESGNNRKVYFEGILANVQQESSTYVAKVEAFTFPYLLEDSILALTDARTLVNHKDDDEPFGFTYRTMTANGYVIHIVYNVVATIGDIRHQTLDQDMDLEPFEFTFYTTPTEVLGAKPTSHFMIHTDLANEAAVFEIEKILYGSDTSSPRFPAVSTILDIFKANM